MKFDDLAAKVFCSRQEKSGVIGCEVLICVQLIQKKGLLTGAWHYTSQTECSPPLKHLVQIVSLHGPISCLWQYLGCTNIMGGAGCKMAADISFSRGEGSKVSHSGHIYQSSQFCPQIGKFRPIIKPIHTLMKAKQNKNVQTNQNQRKNKNKLTHSFRPTTFFILYRVINNLIYQPKAKSPHFLPPTPPPASTLYQEMFIIYSYSMGGG